MDLKLQFEIRRGTFHLSADLQLSGGATAVFGPSGSGKSTLLDCVSGILRPDVGEIALTGTPLFSSESGVWMPPERRRFGYVFQEGLLFPHLSVLNNVRYGRPRQATADMIPLEAIVEVLGIADLLDQMPRELSVGERQRVALARALASSPRLLLLDEPLAALDAQLKRRIIPYLLLIRSEFNVPMLYVTHAVDEVLAISDDVVLMGKGLAKAVTTTVDFQSRQVGP